MAVLKYSDLVDSGLYLKSSDKGQPNGIATLDSSGLVPSTQLPAGTGGGGGGTAPATNVFEFKMNFSNGTISSVEELPSGWTANVTAPTIEVTHDVGSMPKFVSYLGYFDDDPSNIRYQYRVPTAAADMEIPNANPTTKFTINVSTMNTGSGGNSYAYARIIF